MNHLAELKDVSFRCISIDEFKTVTAKLKFTNFALLLDKFYAASECIRVRNVAREAGLRCSVANTNTKIANLISPRGDNTDPCIEYAHFKHNLAKPPPPF